MEVILLQNIKKLGSTGDIANVATGFARNYLMPNKFVLLATKKNKEIFEKQKSDIEKANIEKRKTAELELAKIKNKSIIIVRSAAEDGRLFGAVKKKDIAKALDIFAAEISHNDVFIEDKIKYLGIYKVLINLYGNIETTIQVVVARSESEGKQALINLTKSKETSKASSETNSGTKDPAEASVTS